MKSPELRSELRFNDVLPDPKIFGKDAILLFDEKLKKKFKSWIKGFEKRISLVAGEKLKTWEGFGKLVADFHKSAANIPRKDLKIVAFGGGSVGDTCGFLASIYKRGVSLDLVPTTWLAAVDSAHGGKNGINYGGLKNQLGTFYAAGNVFLIREVLETQPRARETEAWGEIAKMALLDDGLRQLITDNARREIWPLLSDIIRAKMKIVSQDPLDSNGKRNALNLGHTMGHVIEASLNLPHGTAVSQGILFAARLSKNTGVLSDRDYDKMLKFINRFEIRDRLKKRLKEKQVRKMILADKKNTDSDLVNFILLKDFATPTSQNVSLDTVNKTLKEMKWIK